MQINQTPSLCFLTTLVRTLQDDMFDRGGFQGANEFNLSQRPAWEAAYALDMNLPLPDGMLKALLVHKERHMPPKGDAADLGVLFLSFDSRVGDKVTHSHFSLRYYVRDSGPRFTAEKLAMHIAHFFCTGESPKQTEVDDDMTLAATNAGWHTALPESQHLAL